MSQNGKHLSFSGRKVTTFFSNRKQIRKKNTAFCNFFHILSLIKIVEVQKNSSINFKIPRKMNNETYECTICGYIYNPAVGDPDNGIAPGTKFEDIPEDWVCPLCGVGKDKFEKI